MNAKANTLKQSPAGGKYSAKGFRLMANSPQNFDARAVSVVLLDRAKRFWGWALLFAVFGPVLGIVSPLMALPPTVAPITLVLLALIAEVLQWRSDILKDGAESLLRRIDLKDSFGWPISSRELSDLLAQNPGLHQAIATYSPPDAYFGSSEPAGTARALANLEESAWWSKHLARGMGALCLLVVGALILAALVALTISVEAVKASPATQTVELLHAVGDVVTAALALVFSLGLTRLGISYYQFSSKAAGIEGQADQTASHPDQDIQAQNIQAVKLWQDYHLARATAPFIPTWFWKRKRATLNVIWTARNTTR